MIFPYITIFLIGAFTGLFISTAEPHKVLTKKLRDDCLSRKIKDTNVCEQLYKDNLFYETR